MEKSQATMDKILASVGQVLARDVTGVPKEAGALGPVEEKSEDDDDPRAGREAEVDGVRDGGDPVVTKAKGAESTDAAAEVAPSEPEPPPDGTAQVENMGADERSWEGEEDRRGQERETESRDMLKMQVPWIKRRYK